MVKQWYIIHTYSGFEDRVQKTLEQRIEALVDQADPMLRLLVPIGVAYGSDIDHARRIRDYMDNLGVS